MAFVAFGMSYHFSVRTFSLKCKNGRNTAVEEFLKIYDLSNRKLKTYSKIEKKQKFSVNMRYMVIRV